MSNNKVKIIENKICLSTAALCEVLAVSRVTTKRWADEGCPKAAYGWWALADVLRWRGLVGVDGVREAEKDAELTLNQKKLFFEMKYKEAQAEAIELKNEIAQGEYIRRDEVISELTRFFVTIKRSLTGLSRKLATEIGFFVDASTGRRIERQLEEIMNDALYQLSVDGVYEAPKEKKVKG